MEGRENAEMLSLLLESSAESLDNTNILQHIQQIVSFLTTDFSSSSDSDEYELEQHPKCVDFVKTIDSFCDQDFKSHMRMQRQTMEYLISRYSQSLSSHVTISYRGKTRIDSRTTVYMYVWYISNTVTFRQLGDLFGVSRSSAWIAVRRVTSCLIRIRPEFVKWPQGAAAEETQAKFQQKKGIPGIIGAIDCTHVNIKAPKLGKECYFNRKHSYSLVLQAVVDANKKFLDITCGEPGSLHESRVLRRSDLYSRTQTNYADLFPNGSFIIGDSAYPPKSWLVPPFKDYGTLTQSQCNFNKIHSATRIVVENTFGLLKGRFRRLLKFTEQTNLCAITNLIVSACVLHNICISNNDSNDDLYSTTLPETTNSYTSDENSTPEVAADVSSNRRELLFNYLLEHHLI